MDSIDFNTPLIEPPKIESCSSCTNYRIINQVISRVTFFVIIIIVIPVSLTSIFYGFNYLIYYKTHDMNTGCKFNLTDCSEMICYNEPKGMFGCCFMGFMMTARFYTFVMIIHIIISKTMRDYTIFSSSYYNTDRNCFDTADYYIRDNINFYCCWGLCGGCWKLKIGN